MNEYAFAAQQHHACPNVRKGLKLLAALVDAVNAQSDGWAYWQAPRKASQRLIALLESAGNLHHGTHVEISDADLRKAITPIRTMVTRQSELQKKYGNTFRFDVDAALSDAVDGVRCVVACANANGEPDFGFVRISATWQEQIDGQHYDKAKRWAKQFGYEPPYVVFDSQDGPAWLFDHFIWESADLY